jgi:hypothetical protein
LPAVKDTGTVPAAALESYRETLKIVQAREAEKAAKAAKAAKARQNEEISPTGAESNAASV